LTRVGSGQFFDARVRSAAFESGKFPPKKPNFFNLVSDVANKIKFDWSEKALCKDVITERLESYCS